MSNWIPTSFPNEQTAFELRGPLAKMPFECVRVAVGQNLAWLRPRSQIDTVRRDSMAWHIAPFERVWDANGV